MASPPWQTALRDLRAEFLSHSRADLHCVLVRQPWSLEQFFSSPVDLPPPSGDLWRDSKPGSCWATGGGPRRRSGGRGRHFAATLCLAGGSAAGAASPIGIPAKLPPVAQHEPKTYHLC
jgi:hypothetical protein